MPPGDFNEMWTSWNATLDKLGEKAKFVMAKQQVSTLSTLSSG